MSNILLFRRRHPDPSTGVADDGIHYVRPAGGSYGAEDGSTYANAWNGFTNIAWGAGVGQVGPGDVLRLDSEATYTETLGVGTSGTSGNQITIDGTYGAGTRAVIDGDSIRSHGVLGNVYDYLDFIGIESKNHTSSGFYIRAASNDINIRSCNSNNNANGVLAGGTSVNITSSLIIDNTANGINSLAGVSFAATANVFSGNVSVGILIRDTITSVNIRNNIITGSTNAIEKQVGASGESYSYNCIPDGAIVGSPTDGGDNITDNPSLDAQYRPTNSALVGAGVAVAGVTTDYDGNTYSDPPTIGSFEMEGLLGILDNSDPAITYGGRVMREGQFPEWWENWEEPQPTEPPPNPIPLSELLAEAAGALDMPRAKAPAPPKPKAKPQPVGETHALAASIRRTVSVSATITHQDNPLTKDDIVRWQKRHTVALLLLSTLDR